MRKITLILMAFGFLASKAWGADLYVPGSYTTIQAAIDAATTGDTVWVSDGTYTGPGNKDLTWSGKKITVRSVNGAPNTLLIARIQAGVLF